MLIDSEVLEKYAAFILFSMPKFDELVMKEKSLLSSSSFWNRKSHEHNIWWGYDQYKHGLRFEWEKIYSNPACIFEVMDNFETLNHNKSLYAKTDIQKLVEQFFYNLYVGVDCCASVYDKKNEATDREINRRLRDSIYSKKIDELMNRLYPYAINVFKTDNAFLNDERKQEFIAENKKHGVDISQRAKVEEKPSPIRNPLSAEQKSNSDERKYWLDENGIVKCPGNKCPAQCDGNCPIHAQTLALKCMNFNDKTPAIILLENAVRIEPKFADAWNNLAACYGQMGKHKDAYKAYAKSYELLQKPNPLFGMAVAAKNMNDYPLAMQHVTIYQSKFGTDKRITTLAAEISENQLSGQVSNSVPEKADESPVQNITSQSSLLGGTRKNSTNMSAEPVKVSSADALRDNMRQYGKLMLKMLDKDKRSAAYAEMEKLETQFPEAGVIVGQYYQGTDLEKAQKHYKVAADAHIHEGEWGYAGTLPHSHISVQTNNNDAEWELYCLRAANGGCPDAANEMGNICNRRECIAEAAYWYAMAYFLEHPQGLISVKGILQKWINAGKPDGYKAGTSSYTRKRHAAAIAFLKSMTNVNMLNELMTLCLDGETLAGLTAAYFFEQSNEDGLAYKAYNALSLSDHPHPHVLRCCADMMISGKGTERDVHEALKLYEKSAKGGNAVAMYVMGQKALKDGDLSLAACWFGMAYSRGYELAEKSLIQISEHLS